LACQGRSVRLTPVPLPVVVGCISSGANTGGRRHLLPSGVEPAERRLDSGRSAWHGIRVGDVQGSPGMPAAARASTRFHAFASKRAAPRTSLREETVRDSKPDADGGHRLPVRFLRGGSWNGPSAINQGASKQAMRPSQPRAAVRGPYRLRAGRIRGTLSIANDAGVVAGEGAGSISSSMLGNAA